MFLTFFSRSIGFTKSTKGLKISLNNYKEAGTSTFFLQAQTKPTKVLAETTEPLYRVIKKPLSGPQAMLVLLSSWRVAISSPFKENF